MNGSWRLVLAFHGLGEPPGAVSEDEAAYWLPLSTYEAVLDLVQTRDDVLLTFDDGNASDLESAFPPLRERGLSATFFPIVARLGTPGYLGHADVQTLCAAGMRIGLHGMTHRSLRTVPRGELAAELMEARSKLSALLQASVDEVACPFGEYDRRVLRDLRRLGFRRVYTSDGGWARADGWLQPRCSLHGAHALDAVRRLLDEREHRHSLARRAVLSAKRWR